MAYNVPAVYDVFLCAIKETRRVSSAQKNVGGGWRGNERSEWPSQPEPRGPLGPKRKQSCYVSFARTPLFYILSFQIRFMYYSVIVNFAAPFYMRPMFVLA